MESKWVTAEQILETISEIGNFSGYVNVDSGALEWYNENLGLTIFASPNWLTDGEIPFDIQTEDGEYWNEFTIKMIEGDASAQCTHYLNVLLMVMSQYDDYYPQSV